MRVRVHLPELAAPAGGGFLRRAEQCLWITAVGLLSCWTGLFLEARIYQAYRGREFDRAIQAGRATTTPAPPRERAPFQTGDVVGRLEIPSLEMSAIILEGSDARTLRLGVGRVPGSAYPGQAGNIVLGGHRDTFFRPLRQIRPGAAVQLVTLHGTYRYIVRWTAVVSPDDTAVLKETAEPSLTLVTCYPFHFVGPAPERFVVRAGLARSVPAGQGAGNTVQVAKNTAPVTPRRAAYRTRPSQRRPRRQSRGAPTFGVGVKAV